MDILLLAAQTATAGQGPSPWLLILGFISLGYGIYYNHYRGKKPKTPESKRKLNMLGDKYKSAGSMDDAAEQMANRMDKSKKNRKK